jgi:hypothetical protein
MLIIQNNDVLGFIRDFELSSREFLFAQGLTEQEILNAHLDLQWKFLHIILEQPNININYV